MPNVDLVLERKKLDRQITFFHLGRAERKIKKCLRLAKEQKDDFFYYYFLAQKFIIKEEFHKAIKYLNLALSIREFDGCTYNDKALCLADLGKYEQALGYFDEGIKKDKDCASLYHNKGWLLNLLGRYKPAILCFKKALELEEDRVEAIYSLGDTYLHLDNTYLAKKYFQRALRLLRGKSSYVYRNTLKRLKELESW